VAFVLLLAACGPPGEGGIVDVGVPSRLQAILKNPDSITLYTIYFETSQEDREQVDDSKLMGRDELFVILDQTELDPATEGKILIDSFLQSLRKGQELGGAMCFEPHHAIRVEKDGDVAEVIICFLCHNFEVNPGGDSNNIILDLDTGIEAKWRSIVRKHKLRDISDKEK
jgi:hypothetical protein